MAQRPDAEQVGKGERSGEVVKRKMMAACQRDPQLLEQLLSDPDAVAARFKVSLTDVERQQLRKVADLRNIIDDYKSVRDAFGPGPIFYPIDGWWKKVIFYHIRFYPRFYHVFYPADNVFEPVGQLGQGLAARAFRPPDWVFYPRGDRTRLIDMLSNRLRDIQAEIARLRGM